MLLTLHLTFIIITAIAVFFADENGILWMLGKRPLLPKKKVEAFHIIVSVGLAGILLTGGLAFIQAVDYYLGNPAFITKMAFVSALVINGFFIGELSAISITRTYASLSARERFPLLLSGVVSVSGWIGAIICGIVIHYGLLG